MSLVDTRTADLGTPLQTGLGFLPHTLVAIVVGIRLTPRLMSRIDSRALIAAGGLIAAAGFCWQSQITADSGYFGGILGPAIVFSIGSGLLNTPITTTVTSGIDAADSGAASGLMNTTKQFGGALGLAVLVTIAGSHLGTPHALAADYGRAFFGHRRDPGGRRRRGGGPAPPAGRRAQPCGKTERVGGQGNYVPVGAVRLR